MTRSVRTATLRGTPAYNHCRGQHMAANIERTRMIYLNVLLTVKRSEDIERVRGLLTELATASRAEPGCERFEIYQSQNDRALFVLVERWASQAALEAHRLADAFANHYVPNVLPLVERAPHPSELLC